MKNVIKTIGTVWIGLLAVLVSLLFAVAVVGNMATGASIESCFFRACCGLMDAVGMLLGLSYNEICVAVNIYLEAALCVISAFLVTFSCVWSCKKSCTAGRIALITMGFAYSLCYVVGFVCLCRHYAMPMDAAFNLCFRELNMLADEWHTTYNNVNYIIFIAAFLLITTGNIGIAYVIVNTENKSKRRQLILQEQ